MIPEIDKEKLYELLAKQRTYENLRESLRRKSLWMREFGDRSHGSAHLNEAPSSSAGSWEGPRPMATPDAYEDSKGGMSFSPEEEVAAEDDLAGALFTMVRCFQDKSKPGGAGGRYPARAPAGPPRGAGPSGARPFKRAPAAPPRGRREISCVNFGIEGHAIADCRKPRFEKDKRPCFICGQGGHQSHKCPQKPKPQLSVANGDERPEATDGGCSTT